LALADAADKFEDVAWASVFFAGFLAEGDGFKDGHVIAEPRRAGHVGFVQQQGHEGEFGVLFEEVKLGVGFAFRVWFFFFEMLAVGGFHLVDIAVFTAQRRGIGAQDHGFDLIHQCLEFVLIGEADGVEIFHGDVVGTAFQTGLVIGAFDRVADAVMAEIVDAGGDHQGGDVVVVAFLRGVCADFVMDGDQADDLDQDFLMMSGVVIGQIIGHIAKDGGDDQGLFQIVVDFDFEMRGDENAQRQHRRLMFVFVPFAYEIKALRGGCGDVFGGGEEKIAVILQIGEVFEALDRRLFIGGFNGLQVCPLLVWAQSEQNVMDGLDGGDPRFDDLFGCVHGGGF